MSTAPVAVDDFDVDKKADETLKYESSDDSSEESESESYCESDAESCNFECPEETHKEFLDTIEAYRYLFQHFYDGDGARVITCINHFDRVIQVTNYDDTLYMDVVKRIVAEKVTALVPYRAPVWLEVHLLLFRLAFIRACAFLVLTETFPKFDEMERILTHSRRFYASTFGSYSLYFAFLEHLVDSLAALPEEIRL